LLGAGGSGMVRSSKTKERRWRRTLQKGKAAQ
jgi:hypothetical protein